MLYPSSRGKDYPIRIATFNVENPFSRAAAFNLANWAKGRPILEAFARVSDLLQRDIYTLDMKAEIIGGLMDLELDKSDEGRGLVMFRQIREKLVSDPGTSPWRSSPRAVPTGLDGWS